MQGQSSTFLECPLEAYYKGLIARFRMYNSNRGKKLITFALEQEFFHSRRLQFEDRVTIIN
uniref:Uncharacterized protein n=1 Tax=Romanomermis culicivorax TaxID=13658 RepID=A0A915KSD4_ROMCU